MVTHLKFFLHISFIFSIPIGILGINVGFFSVLGDLYSSRAELKSVGIWEYERTKIKAYVAQWLRCSDAKMEVWVRTPSGEVFGEFTPPLN